LAAVTEKVAAVYQRGRWLVSNISDIRIMWNITTWTPIYGRLGTRRLGTAFLCISFVD
jgi:hypothetical protein